MDSLVVQYVIIAVIVLGAGYYLFSMIRKKFAPNKFKSKSPGCNSDCGCS